jgi:uncharacterized protein YbjQ (UPF0145 family)
MMMDSFGTIFQVGLPLFLLLLAWFTGRYAERRHYRSLKNREQEMADMLVTDLKTFPGDVDASRGGELVQGQAVIATDYLKSFLAGLRNIFGGEVKSYETLLQRARREAILRMMAQARGRGYNAVCNIRLTMSDIGGMAGAKGAAMVEVLAWGTAYKMADR